MRDTITGFRGIAIARSIWLTGCDRITIQPKTLDKDGKIREQATFDEGTVEVIKVKAKPRKNNDRGGPQREIAKHGHY